jgi:hypothetical protein
MYQSLTKFTIENCLLYTMVNVFRVCNTYIYLYIYIHIGQKEPSIRDISELAVFSLAESRQSSFKMPQKFIPEPIKD